MKKRKIITLLTIALIIFGVFSVNVLAYNGTGEQDQTDINNKANCNGSYTFHWQVETDERVKTAAYRFDLVYKPKNGNRYIIKTVVAQSIDQAGGTWGCTKNLLKNKVKDYVNAANAVSDYEVVYRSEGPLVDIASYLAQGGYIDNRYGEGKINEDDEIRKMITGSQGFAVKESDMQLQQDETPGDINSYGYRILIQKIIVTAHGAACRTCNQMVGDGIAITRKEAASNAAVKTKLVGNMDVYIAPYETTGAGDLYTTKNDIGIIDGSPFKLQNNEKGKFTRNRKGWFADWNNGLGYNILWFRNIFNSYDYSIDAACENCDSTDSENKAYIIQDTTNWEAIKNSRDSSNDKVKTYYYKTNSTYCREEYKVKFPNKTNTIQVETGRYFTVNASDEDQSKMISTGIPNFKPVTVTKTRYCQGGNLQNYFDSNKSTFEKNPGTVYFKYTENYKDSKYSMSEKKAMKKYGKTTNHGYETQDGINTLRMEVTYSYTLPDNFYQYIKKNSGESKEDVTTDKDKYINTVISNIPISYDNNSTYPVTLQFSYDLPESDSNSYMYKAYNTNDGDNSWLKNSSTNVDNIYKKYIKNKISTNEEQSEIKQSACAKMYGYGTTEFKTCATNRQTNKIGDGSNNCYKKNAKIDKGTSTEGYSCTNNISTKNECTTDGNKYYDKNGKEITKEQYNGGTCKTCRYDETTGKYYDKNGKEITKKEYNDGKCDPDPENPKCKIVTIDKKNIYYGINRKIVTKAQYEIECPKCKPNEKECNGECINKDYSCPQCTYCGGDPCCPSGECMVNGICPTGGKTVVIYRTIDLTNPFPGQQANKRKTGNNWCSYEIKTQTIDCSWNNNVSSSVIRKTTKAKNKDNGSAIYKNKAGIYQVTLTRDDINAIRKYNDSNNNKYDDFKLKCLKNGRACVSEFLRKYLDTDKKEGGGECANSGKNNFYTCDKVS